MATLEEMAGSPAGPADLETLRTVALFLGPYRNLTTLTASMLFLHPHCQVLNHAGTFVYATPQLNFVADYSDERFQRFSAFALQASQSGGKGARGGSIRFGHAFAKQPKLEVTYRARFGDLLLKPEVHSLVWKESMLTSNALRKNRIDVEGLLRACPKLRFLLPIRNPIDCAISNHQTGLAQTLGVPRGADVTVVVRRIVEELAWALRLAASQPSKFCCFFQSELDGAFLERLARFLDLDVDARWLTDCEAVLELKPSYSPEPALRAAYAAAVRELMADLPEQERFLQLAES